ncbi:uncharacterized protein LOC125964253 isoform X1 [Orcinus orca]|uniref:uncharacterized protein LOC125964253 isoform X1 n=1 Tax=Orcinus orca TaxID=9733 RepID=UPI0021113101|nr:uncharacterized protein LOC125964253 isoform X1 [Orcinus orca]
MTRRAKGVPSVQGESQGFDRVGQWGRLRAGGLEVCRGERGFQLGECWGHSQRWEGVPGGRWVELPERAELRLSVLQSSLGGILKAGFPNAAKQSSPSTALGLADVHLGMTCGGSRQGAWSSGREAATRVCIPRREQAYIILAPSRVLWGQHRHLLQLLVPPGADPLRERTLQHGCRPCPGGPAAGRSFGGLSPHRLSSAAALPLVAVEWPTTSPGAGFPHLDGVMWALLRCCVKICVCRQRGGGRGEGVLAEPKCVPLGFRVALSAMPQPPQPWGTR